MAEVLGPIVGSTNTMTILRSQDAFQSSQSQSHLAAQRVSQRPRNSMYNPQLSALGYSGPQGVTIAPYAFNTTPPLRDDRRRSSGPVIKQHSGHILHSQKPLYHGSSSSSVSSASSSSNRSKDDSVLGLKERQTGIHSRLSANMAASLSTPDLSLNTSQPAKPSPDRYRRQSRNMENASPVVDARPNQDTRLSRQIPAPIPPYSVRTPSYEQSPTPRPSAPRQPSMDGTINTAAPNSTRYKRRSVVGMDSPVLSPAAAPANVPSPPALVSAPSWSQVVAGKHNFNGPLPPPVPISAHGQHLRSISSGDNRPLQTFKPSAPRSATYDVRPGTAPSMSNRVRTNIATPVNSSTALRERPSTAVQGNKPVEQMRPSTSAGRIIQTDAHSSAVQQLSASLTVKANQKGVKSRLRRAFSFSSSHELRKASAENNLAAERAKLRKERFDNNQDAEDAAVAAKQEASGLGNNIYSGQGQFATSTDNISMASTASSASIMLRNIGKGMKKSTRNLRALFRPKSVIGAPEVDSSVAEPAAEVTLVTVEAEQEQVNVNIDPHDKPGGGTGYPKLERNSMEIDEEKTLDAPQPSIGPRKSIVGGDRERAEVLAAVRKGILKRPGTSSSSSSPSIAQAEIALPFIPGNGSAPVTPDRRGSADSSERDYFTTVNATSSTRSLPTTTVRNISFSTRVQFFDVWSPSEYDRRGEIATCNRLTPILAQQIKEELNSFKMEMEVHEESKPHTHFF